MSQYSINTMRGYRCVGCLCCLLAGFAVADEPRQHWAFQPITSITVPTVTHANRVRNEIDEFVVHALERKDLTLAPDADASSLIRRVYFDLTGLPPSRAEIQKFIQDSSPQAYERMLDSVLTSPHFGERWGRHWLDNAGYVDVQGLDNDAGIISSTENKWMYRDYVIDSFNSDKPFDRFLLEQLAGDECTDWRHVDPFTAEIQTLLVATGFLRNSADDTNANELNRKDVRHQILERTHEVVVNNLLGLTFQCAKCHDHKYEPILQTDYYKWQAFFEPAFNPANWLSPASRQLPNVAPSEKKRIDEFNSTLEQQIAVIKDQITTIRKPFERKLFELKLAGITDQIRDDTDAAIKIAADQRTDIQKYLASKFEAILKVKSEEVTAILPQPEKDTIMGHEKEIAALQSKKRAFKHWQVVYDVGTPTPTHLLHRGDPLSPSDEVQPEMLSVLTTSNTSNQPITQQFGSSGRRRTLAKYLTNPLLPAGSLVIRVRVNRIWQHLFGRGIVPTTDNFGLTGSPPTHLELLEWLSSAFVADGQHLKPFLKRIMTSSAYRQTSARNDDHSRQVDPDNTLIWKQRMKRLESEAVRDAILTVSGKLDRSMGGEPIPVEPRPDGSFVVKSNGLPTPTSQYRRTIYLLARRNYHPTLLGVFDQPNLATNCSERSSSAVVLQSLAMLNDAFVLEQADALSDRIMAMSDSKEPWITNAFETVLDRAPSEREARSCASTMTREIEFHLQSDATCTIDMAERRAFTRVCHTLLNTSEFLMIP